MFANDEANRTWRNFSCAFRSFWSSSARPLAAISWVEQKKFDVEWLKKPTWKGSMARLYTHFPCMSIGLSCSPLLIQSAFMEVASIRAIDPEDQISASQDQRVVCKTRNWSEWKIKQPFEDASAIKKRWVFQNAMVTFHLPLICYKFSGYQYFLRLYHLLEWTCIDWSIPIM